MTLEKYSMGIGDRFSHQGEAQLSAFLNAKEKGVTIVPVWNKSKREHTMIGSSPNTVRSEADKAVTALNWKDAYYVDADHIGLNTVDAFVEYADFYTLDVADFIGQKPTDEDLYSFLELTSKYIGSLVIPNVSKTFLITEDKLINIAEKYLVAIKEASKIYNHIKTVKGEDNFVTEVSVDESNEAQSPEELFFILCGLAAENIPVQTIAPKFTGRFNKGVDYVGDVNQFIREFEDDVAVINFAVKEFSLPMNLKLSIHSGSDKFSLYKPINDILNKYDAGLHLKTAGTTWLEELIGLAEAGGDGLEISKEIYQQSFLRSSELMKPYATVVDIDFEKLPKPEEVWKWSSEDFTNALRHDQTCDKYNIHFRQLLHLGFKIAAEMGDKYYDALKKYDRVIGKNVFENIYDRHIKILFLGE